MFTGTPQKKDKDSREGKGRRCCLGYRIPYQFLIALAILHREEFILFFISSWCNSSFSSNHPGAIQPFLQVILVKSSQRGKEQNHFCPPKQQRRLISTVFILLFFNGVHYPFRPDFICQNTLRSRGFISLLKTLLSGITGLN